MTQATDAVSAITAHHSELQAALSEAVAGVLRAAREARPTGPAAGELAALLARDIVPHARAEEDVLYAAGTSPTLAPLVTGMIFEHETLLALAGELSAATDPVDAAAAARAIEAVFTGHVRRENELLLPALAGEPAVDLPALVAQMQRSFASYRAVGAP